MWFRTHNSGSFVRVLSGLGYVGIRSAPVRPAERLSVKLLLLLKAVSLLWKGLQPVWYIVLRYLWRDASPGLAVSPRGVGLSLGGASTHAMGPLPGESSLDPDGCRRVPTTEDDGGSVVKCEWRWGWWCLQVSTVDTFFIPQMCPLKVGKEENRPVFTTLCWDVEWSWALG